MMPPERLCTTYHTYIVELDHFLHSNLLLSKSSSSLLLVPLLKSSQVKESASQSEPLFAATALCAVAPRTRSTCPFCGRCVGRLASWYRQSTLQRVIFEVLNPPRCIRRFEKRIISPGSQAASIAPFSCSATTAGSTCVL